MFLSRGRAVSALVAAAVALVVTGPAAHASSVPYSDDNAVGALTLCDASNQPVRSGSTSTAPFVAAAVSSFAAPSPYDSDGRTATLFAFQPRKGVAPGQWSGELLTAATRYTTSDHPISKFTAADGSLADFVNSYPPAWDGFVQLRIYLGAPGQPPYSQQYAAADIRVTGDTWTLVSDAPTACAAGQGTSIEDLLPTQDTTRAISGVAITTVPGTPRSPSDDVGLDRRAALPRATNASSDRSGATAAVVVALLGAGVLVIAITRRLRRVTPQTIQWRSR